MDDMTIITTPTIGTRWILKGIEKLITWPRMSFKLSKSRSLVFKKDKKYGRKSVLNYPNNIRKPIKSLGKRIDHSLRDTREIQETNDH